MKNIKENAAITLVNERTSDGEKDRVEFTTAGRFHEKDGKFYIFYKEHEDMGMGDSSVMIKVEDDSVIMRRNGDFKTVIVYRENEFADIIYRTPLGEMTMKLKTEKIENNMHTDGGELRFSYFLFMNGEETHNKIFLKVKPERIDSV
ncbi:MAG: DUF1934 domain-containing protein [Firmicutes bacterium]|nr:DUF1934 domain-containing protein [Bacillota bacterium]